MELEYKGYKIKGDGTFGMKKIHTIGAGKLPVKLNGVFTNFDEAKKAVDSYLINKEVKDAKASSTSRGK